jgi:glyoxylate/hydroxypyruvate reductase
VSLNILYAANPDQWEVYFASLSSLLKQAGIAARIARDIAPEEVDYIVYAPGSELQDFTPYRRCKAVMSLWAGVERITGNKTLTQPLTRMVDSGLEEGMCEWVAGHVLRYHLGMDRHILGQNGEWRQQPPPLARNRRVGVLGLGALGQAVAQTLAGLKFDTAGWSRRGKDVAGISCYSGGDGLRAVLARSEILVLLLPDTAETSNLLNADSLALMPRGAMIVNPGRGPLIEDEALLAALDSGQISHATLDVFRVEPLPADHRYWAHPNVTVTPHIASDTRADTASQVVVENIRRCEAGDALMFLVDRKVGY